MYILIISHYHGVHEGPHEHVEGLEQGDQEGPHGHVINHVHDKHFPLTGNIFSHCLNDFETIITRPEVYSYDLVSVSKLSSQR